MRVLVVEDEPAVADLVRQVIVAEGHQALVARRGAEAIEAALVQDFDLLVTDLMLPDLPGVEIIRALKAQAPQLPVIVMSALDPVSVGAEVANAGAARFLQKPLKLAMLRDELRLVAAARAGLRITVIDADSIHGVRLSKTLQPLGCDVVAYASAMAAIDAAGKRRPSLVLLDGSLPDAVATVRWAHANGIPAFVFSEVSGAANEDTFMRAGASLFLLKPIDTEALLTQARFLAGV